MPVTEVRYNALSLADVAAELSAVTTDSQSLFGRLDEHQLNWRPDVKRWSVAQCFDHLLNINREMFQAMAAAADGSTARTVWQRLPLLPRLWGRMLITSQMPEAKRKFTAPRKAEPAVSAIDPRIIERFVASQQDAAARVRSFDERGAGAAIMVSPFASFITYSVTDGCRLVVTHQRRHFEQARRVTQDPGFPASAFGQRRA
jgi:hypothetical protein